MLAAGTLLQGRYKIMEPLNEGGMSVVYLAEDQVLGNRVAVKEMKDGFLSAQERALAAQQFRKEAHILANLEHPGLPRVSNFFEQNQRHYLVMDYISGNTLEALLHQHEGRLPEALVLCIGAAVCRVLDYLHQVQPAVIFRDLKPSNIMLSRAGLGDGEEGRVKLIDFGISKIFDAVQGTHTIIKGAGTPGFAPPEQYGAQGRMRTDTRSDIYSLGATMYALLTGQVPTEATDRWMNGVVLPAPTSLNPQIGAPTEALILKMMELKPQDRPKTAREVFDAIQVILAARGVMVTPDPPGAPTTAVHSLAGPAASQPNHSNVAPAAPRRFRSSRLDGTSTADGGRNGSATPRDDTWTAGIYPFVGAACSIASVTSPTAEPAIAMAATDARIETAPAESTPRESGGGEDSAHLAASWPSIAPPPPAATEGTGAVGPSIAWRPAEAQNPTVLGRVVPRRSTLMPTLVAVAALGLLIVLLGMLGLLPVGTGGSVEGGSASSSVGGTSSTVARHGAVEAPTPTAVDASALPVKPVPTRIGVTCVPAGARILVDGVDVGASTASESWFVVTSGAHDLKCKKSGYVTYDRRIDAQAHQDTPLQVDLVKAASLLITASPASARISLDGKSRGAAGQTLDGLSQGTHTYKVYAANYVQREGTIALQPGQNLHIDVKLKSKLSPAMPPISHLPTAPPYHPPVPVPVHIYRPPVPSYHPAAPSYHPPPYTPPLHPRATPADIPGPQATPR